MKNKEFKECDEMKKEENIEAETLISIEENAIFIAEPLKATHYYPSNFYDATKIIRCDKCGEKRRSINGFYFCPTNDSECPLFKQ